MNKNVLKNLYNHPGCIVLCNTLLVLLLMSLSRLVYYWVNIDLYADVDSRMLFRMMWGGVRFDISATMYLNSVYFVLALLPFPCRTNPIYQKITSAFFYIPNLFAFFCNGVDTIYTRFSARRTTIQFFKEFAGDDNLGGILFKSIFQYWYVSLFIIAIGAILIIGYRSIKTVPNKRYVSQSLLLCVVAYFVVIGMRSSFKDDRPLQIHDATLYTVTPQQTNIVLNTPFTLLASIGMDEQYKSPNYFPTDSVAQYMSPIHHPTDSVMCKKNVVIFILESFSKETSGFFNPDLVGYTPFMDSIYAHSVTYKNSFACGRKSIDAVPAVLSGIPILISSFLRSIYSTNTVSSIADCLDSVGYYTAFFHGAVNGSMGFEGYTNLCGFKKYYGLDEYNNMSDYGNNWGIWDEEFLQYMCHNIDTFQQPFCASVFTLSSHHPFELPKRYEGVFPEGPKPLYHSIGYADYSLRKFFETASKTEWYRNTLFVFSADHTAWMTEPRYLTDKGFFEIPIAFFSPAGDLPARIDTTPISQVDIMPSILAYLGYNKPFFAFGEDVLMHPKTHPYAISYHEPLFQIFSNHLLVQYDGLKITGIYDFVKDNLLRTNLVDMLVDNKEVQDMVLYLKAYIQQYIDCMNTDALTIHSQQ